jgi:7,8-dihydropterin-6-yl-methyl-4-(beta-D-ribofuranosyl)aminobenzene 5'-phosphate synthase
MVKLLLFVSLLTLGSYLASNVGGALTSTIETSNLRITVVYDNNRYDTRLAAGWGFASAIEYGRQTLLFDTGGHGQTLLQNMAVVGLDPAAIDSVVLSHFHGDHTGGLDDLLDTGARPVVYLLPCFPTDFKNHVRQKVGVIEVAAGQNIAPGAYTTGGIDGTRIIEQSLVLKTNRGLVVVTGCAHPGIVRVVERARDMYGEPVFLVMGGFHLGNSSHEELKSILADFRRLGVERVAPLHCSGHRAVEMFKREYQTKFIDAGVGRIIIFEP